MSYLNHALAEAARIGFSTVFNEAFANTPTLYERLALVVRTSNPIEEYHWSGTVPKIRPWVGDRPHQKLRAYKFSLSAAKFASGLEVDKTDIEDDRLGLVAPRIRMLAETAARHYDELLFDYLVDGFGNKRGLAYDGKTFFAGDHKDADGPKQSNVGTAPLSMTSYEDAWAQLMTLKDESGEPIDITPTHLLVGPQLRAKAREILLADRNANGSSNTNFGTSELIVSHRLAAHPTKWFLVDLRGSNRPLILQIRRPIQFVAQDQPGDEHAYMRDVFRYGTDGRHAAGYALWQYAYGSTGEGAAK